MAGIGIPPGAPATRCVGYSVYAGRRYGQIRTGQQTGVRRTGWTWNWIQFTTAWNCSRP